jgi:CheY-like chemotaxis protein
MSEQTPLVLVVDDNEMNRDMLARRLERQGCSSITAEDGIQALELIPQHDFDLILLDIMMPRMTGYEVLDRVKNDPVTRHIPVIMISAVDDLESVVKCVEKGADDYLFKPFNPILLKARISASLEKKRLRDTEHDLLQQTQSGGASEAHKALIERFFTGLANGGFDNSCIAQDFTLLEAGQNPVSLDALRRAMSGVDFSIQEMIAEGDKVAVQLTIQPANVSLVTISRIIQNQIASQQLFVSQPDWLQR